ncbi:MAG: hypothetical protein A2Y40_10590 [Candidatus Margulisbacteria bacterium GWF2_35_9]|nr:MAG: hypothetical protein A2Y40_10590 [Candidatus Margulisbacteria bacterium GWF2_35_9]
MFDILRNSENAMRAFESGLKINTANMGNMSTIGYKSIQYNFQSIFGQVLNNGSSGSASHGGTNPVQQGQGVSLSAVKIDFSQGDLGAGGKLDLAIQGNGFFIVSASQGDDYFFTRAGNFTWNNNGYLVNSSGRKVYGFPYIGNEQYAHSMEPIYLENNRDAGWQFDGSDGILVKNYEKSKNGDPSQPVYKIALTDFSNRSGLLQHDGTTFRATSSSGPAFAPCFSQEQGLGSAISGSVEKSNVFFIGETIDATETQRAMQASLTSMKIASQIIDNVIQMLGN